MDSGVSTTPTHKALVALRNHLSETIIGQERLLNRLLVALLADGHILVEGAPGLAKTRAIKDLARGLAATFQRIQFTPDLLPADITGTDVFSPEEGSFSFHKGPVFHNLILADEINRAPAKVQAALLEAMAERQVSIGGTTHPISGLFLVMATQNPIEQEGTYPLPEAQLDRFLMHVCIDYPTIEAERVILRLARGDALSQPLAKPAIVSQETLQKAGREVLNLHMADAVEKYIIHLIDATRHPSKYKQEVGRLLEYGASPRGTIALDRCARAHAWLAGRDYVTPDDVQEVAYDVLRHRIIPSYEAQAQGITVDHILTLLLQQVAVA